MAREIFSDLANKWALLIIEALGDRTLLFGELRDEVEGVSHKMPTQNLRMLEHNGLIHREVTPSSRHGSSTPTPNPAGPVLHPSTAATRAVCRKIGTATT